MLAGGTDNSIRIQAFNVTHEKARAIYRVNKYPQHDSLIHIGNVMRPYCNATVYRKVHWMSESLFIPHLDISVKLAEGGLRIHAHVAMKLFDSCSFQFIFTFPII